MTNSGRYDVIIIGTGAGGATLAYRLAPSGKRILLLARGGYVPREKDNWNPTAVNAEGKYQTKEVWGDRDGRELYPHTNCSVGGNTNFYGGRFATTAGSHRHGRFCTRIWSLTTTRRLTNSTMSTASGVRIPPNPLPPARIRTPGQPQPRMQLLSNDFARAGLRPFHTPLGVMLDENRPQSSKGIQCNTCDGYPCLVYAKPDAQVVGVDPALEHTNVTLLTNAYVSRLETRASGREVTSVLVERNGSKETYAADILVISCRAINSAALLLPSANDKHPQGLANSSDTVGRHYMGHVNSVLRAVSKCPNPRIFQKTLSVNDFYFSSEEWEYPMGHISFVGKLDRETLEAGAPAIAPGFTLELMAEHSLDFWLTSEDLPDPENRVTLDREGNIVLAYKPNNEESHEHLIKKVQSVMKQQTKCPIHGLECPGAVRANPVYRPAYPPGRGGTPEPGTIRFGRDPKTSALDTNCKAHDLDNLFVDGLFPLKRRCESGADDHGKRRLKKESLR